MKVFDLESALERALDDRQFLLDLVLNFEETFPEKIDKIKSLVSTGAFDQAYKEVHSLKGALLNLGAEKAGNLAKQFEVKLKEGDLDVQLSQLEQFVAEFLEEAKVKLTS